MHSIKINALHQEYNELIEFCREHKQLSFEMYINDTYKRSLLLSAASFFETTISKAVYDFAGLRSRGNPELVALVNNKAIQRQYHTLFDWDSNNANKFLRLFGESFKQKARLLIQEKSLADAEIAFMTIGRERNILVHQNYIEAQVNNTFEEIFEKYTLACTFVEFLVQLLLS